MAVRPARARYVSDSEALCLDVRGLRRLHFSDPESLRVLTTAARGLAGQLGRQAAREYFAEVLDTQKVR